MYVVATAGHVDHGKSTLIHALTGMEPDRWAEERRRAMTIDLGFAWTTLSDGTALAFVDVPGHQRFIANMLAGIGPVPAVLLVVAADEGWRKQTGEHLAALEALGVAHGVLAVTRSDLGDTAWSIEQAHIQLADTALAGIETVAVSAVTGAGIPELRAAIERMVAALPRPSHEYTRLWVDRIFTIRGAGTVVTGTLGTGKVSVGDELVVTPSGERVYVRALETLKEQVTSASAVARVALNLRGAKRHRLHRGDALVGPGHWVDADMIDVRLIQVTGRLPAQPIVHIGSAAVAARLRPINEQFVRLNLSRALPLHVGERLLLRDPGQQRVLAGAVVLDVLPPPLVGRGAAKARARDLDARSSEPDERSEILRRHFIRREALWSTGVVIPDPTPNDVLAIGEWLIEPAQWTRWQQELRATVREWANLHPLQPGIPAAVASEALRLPDPKLIQSLVASLPGLVNDGDGVHEAEAKIVFPEEVRCSLDGLIQRLAADAFDAPDAHELAATGLTEKYLSAAAKQGELVRVTAGIYLGPQAMTKALETLARLSQPFTVSEARLALGTTRRVATPLLELLDKQRATRRIDIQHRIVVPHALVPTRPQTDSAATDPPETRP